MAVSSRDSGNTWNAPVFISFVDDIMDTFPPEKYRVISLPAFACNPKTGQLYIAWSNKGESDANILSSTSQDNRHTWSKPLRINDDPPWDGANQFQPQMAVALDGVLSISSVDTRRDPQHRRIDVYLTQSINHGISFLKNVLVTTQSGDPAVRAPTDESGLQFIGDLRLTTCQFIPSGTTREQVTRRCLQPPFLARNPDGLTFDGIRFLDSHLPTGYTWNNSDTPVASTLTGF